MDALLQDLRYALRGLRRSPGFAAAAVLTLALAIGANVAIFSLIRGILLHPLPYGDSERLVSVAELHPQEGARLASYPTFEDWQRESRSLEDLAFIRGQTVIFRSPEGPEQLIAGYVSPDFFRVTGSVPLLGRGFAAEEELPGGADAAVISHPLWRRRFGGDPAAIGRIMTIGDRNVSIIGVLPPGFAYPPWATLWMPITSLSAPEQALLTARDLHTDSRVIARLRPGFDLRRAEADMNALAERLAAAHPKESSGWTRVELSALGEEPARTRRSVVLGGMRLVGIAIGIGLAGSLLLARLIAGLLYGVAPGDPLTLAAIAALLAGVALLACYLPARRATSVDPALALRSE